MIRVCPECDVENRLESVHCRDCGRKLPEPTAGMMGPPSSLRHKSHVRSVLWVLVLLAAGAIGFWVKENVAWKDVRSGTAGFYDAWQNVQSAVSGAMNRWHAKWLSPDLLPAPVPAPAKVSVPTSSIPVPPPVNTVKIRCRRCGGLGYIGDATHKSTCILCNQNGGRTMILPAGAEVCAACQGMGQIIRVVNGNEVKIICKMCAGMGYIVRKY